MGYLSLAWECLGWYYSTALAELFGLDRSLLRFLLNFFSIWVLFRTLFAPWRRLAEEASFRFTDPGPWIAGVIVTSLMRVVGFLLRLLLIVIGGVVLVVSAFGVVAVFIGWLVLPAVILFLFYAGGALLFS